jgi:hypothetical protein
MKVKFKNKSVLYWEHIGNKLGWGGEHMGNIIWNIMDNI